MLFHLCHFYTASFVLYLRNLRLFYLRSNTNSRLFAFALGLMLCLAMFFSRRKYVNGLIGAYRNMCMNFFSTISGLDFNHHFRK